MRRYIVLLLISATVWAQTGLVKLVLKGGTFVINFENKYNKLSYAEYEKLNEEEKDGYNKNLRKIKLRQLKSCTMVGCLWFSVMGGFIFE